MKIEVTESTVIDKDDKYIYVRFDLPSYNFLASFLEGEIHDDSSMLDELRIGVKKERKSELIRILRLAAQMLQDTS